MSAASGAFSAKAGYNQSGGGYLYVVSTIINSQLLTYTPGSASVGSFAAANLTNMPSGVSTLFMGGRVVRDMGKAVVSSSRVFKKIQGIASETNAPSTEGVTGPAATTTNPGYATFYVETTPNQSLPIPLVRYL